MSSVARVLSREKNDYTGDGRRIGVDGTTCDMCAHKQKKTLQPFKVKTAMC